MTTEVAEQTITWSGILTRKMTVNLRQELLAVLLHGASRLTINLVEVEAFDLSCLLLLCAVKRHTVCRGQSLVLEGAENAAVVAIVSRYGYGGERFCLAKCGGVCLWAKTKSKQQLQASGGSMSMDLKEEN